MDEYQPLAVYDLYFIVVTFNGRWLYTRDFVERGRCIDELHLTNKIVQTLSTTASTGARKRAYC